MLPSATTGLYADSPLAVLSLLDVYRFTGNNGTNIFCLCVCVCSSWTNKLITAKDHASVQLNIGHLDKEGVYETGKYSTFALTGAVRGQVSTIAELLVSCAKPSLLLHVSATLVSLAHVKQKTRISGLGILCIVWLTTGSHRLHLVVGAHQP
jgi:hypothetical protein